MPHLENVLADEVGLGLRRLRLLLDFEDLQFSLFDLDIGEEVDSVQFIGLRKELIHRIVPLLYFLWLRDDNCASSGQADFLWTSFDLKLGC